ncbi:hypothetical protein JCM31826_18700 [Thermaurantimonas aggregans]|uniref:YbbR-like domain-containing protein n=1 Tax=Thermaurantimonas aggregans TaxID=2173829 RepID=A0A401XN05_9FLAO|nr:hypothetical protein [Thermaurantimonas aggregans]MCX8149760.1 hypothetical protein [Thermaurantimonas aggregans]GCD78388.1 hypothetical protein JCM31826_18700 [Thermaurantimonas aggregans]
MNKFPLDLYQKIKFFLSYHSTFFIILGAVVILVIFNQLNQQDLPGTTTYIEVKQLPKIYLADSSKLKVEIFHLNTKNKKSIPRILAVNFHSFNFHTPSNRWYLTKNDFQELLREHTIVRIVPDTVWFSPWFSTVKKLPVRINFEVPQPFELVNARIYPEYIPLLHREANDLQVKEIQLGTLKLRRDRRLQEVEIKLKPHLPEGTVSNVQIIKVLAEIGQWKPEKITLKRRINGTFYDFTLSFEIPVTDQLDQLDKCIQIRRVENVGFKAEIRSSVNCQRIRNLKIASVHEVN